MRDELGATPPDGPLHFDTDMAGSGCADEDEDENSPPAGLQRRLAIQLESHRIQQLQDELKALPPVSLSFRRADGA